MLVSILFTAILLLLPNIVISVPISYSTTELPIQEIIPPKLTCMHVSTNIQNRYARTVVKSKYVNPMNQTQGTTFTISLPDTAFISGFVMYKLNGEKKEEIKRNYQQAVESSSRSSLITRDSKTFTISANIDPLSKILFSLTYEQLLQRKYGKYEMIINLYPGQLVDNFHVDVNINETRRIINVNTPALRSGTEITEDIKVAKNQFATISKLNNDDTEVNIKFSPTVQQQKEMAVGSTGTDGSKGIAGQFVVEYDVERDPKGGEVIIDDNYFVHFFAPTELKPIPKHIVFVLDVSGSMSGNRIRQLREAMQVILTKLNSEDYFHLVKFSSGVQVWNEVWKNSNELPEPYLATEDNIQKVQNIVKQLSAGGGTNIYDALAGALKLTTKGVAHLTEIQPMIVFLTDGETSNYDKILNMVKSNNVGKKASIFTVSFGYDANQGFLETVASQNLGFMKIIYDGADASLQLEDFYKEISTPLLTNVKFTYPGQVSNVTNNKFDILFEGSEFAVAGKLTYSSNKFVNVNGRSSIGIQEFIPNYFVINSEPYKKTKYASIERIWAHMRIKQLLNKKYEITNIETNRSPQEEAVAIALKYSFVTPVSTIDVVQFNSTEDYDDDTCTGPDFSEQLSKNSIKLKVGESVRARTEMKTNLPMSGSFSSNSNFLRFGGYSYSTSTSSSGLN